jgi:O-antigen biosynthesis protein
MTAPIPMATPVGAHADLLSPLFSSDLAPLFWRPSRIGVTSAWWTHVPFAQWLITATRPRSIVELGTHGGVSYAPF